MFDLTIAKNELLPKILMVAGAVDKRQALPILSNILLKIKENTLSITATDLEIEISAQIACISDISQGGITAPARKFIDILRSLDDQSTLNIVYQSSVLVIKSGRSQFKLATLPADDFPSSENETALLSFEMPKAELMYLLQTTHFAMSQQDVRVFLNGLFLEFEGNSIKAVGTDAHRMAICKIETGTKYSPHRLLLPRKGVLEMLRVLNAIPDEHIRVNAGNTYFQIQTEDFSFMTKLLEARFPPYNKAIPRENNKFVLIDKEMLKRALSRILILANEKSKAVLMHLQPSCLTLIANNQENEEAIEAIEAQVEGEELKIGINAGYLLDVLNYIADTHVRLSMSAVKASILVEPLKDENYQYVIMPMTL
jgi:DNA polymerase-3 subunit beta